MSQQSACRAPDRPGASRLCTMAVLALGAFPGCACLWRACLSQRSGALDSTRVLFGWRFACVPLLGRRRGSHFFGLGLAATVARKRKLPAANTITFVSYIPPHTPRLMWQLSAYCFAQCQGNRHGVGQDKE